MMSGDPLPGAPRAFHCFLLLAQAPTALLLLPLPLYRGLQAVLTLQALTVALMA